MPMAERNSTVDVAEIARQLSSQVRAGKTDRSRRKLSTLLELLSRRRLDRGLLRALEVALAAEGISCNPSLTAERLGRDDSVWLSRPGCRIRTSYSLRESTMRRLLEELIGAPDGPFCDFRRPTNHQRIHEVTLRSGARVDLLLRSLRNGQLHEWLVIELKGRRSDVGAVQQLKRYMDELETEGRTPLRGIVVATSAPGVKKELSPAGQSRWPIEWWVFDLQLGPAPGWGRIADAGTRAG